MILIHIHDISIYHEHFIGKAVDKKLYRRYKVYSTP